MITDQCRMFMSYRILRSSIRRSVAVMKYMLLLTALAIAPQAARRSSSGALRPSPSQELTVTSNLTDQEVEPSSLLTFTLSRTLQAAEGRLAVVIGQTDISSLLTPTGNSLSYLPRILTLPAGESSVRVFLVTPSNEWRELAQLTLRVKTPSPAEARSGQSGEQTQPSAANPAQTASAKKYSFTPSLTLGMKSQMGERHFPVSNRPERPTFADITLQASLKSEFKNEWFGNQAQFDLAGSSFEKEALRFSTLGVNAPKLDLSSYLLQFQLDRLNGAKFQVGHTNFGTSRHLINSFGGRGVTFSIPLGKRSGLSLAALNGTSIVGWNNFFGLDRSKHQILSATLGFEFIGDRPGGLRLEAGALRGSLQPIAGFNQGALNDAEQSKGASLRLLAADKAQRLKLDAGFTRSLFNNPTDPLLNRNQPVVPVKETTRNALYVDASYALLQNLKLSEKKTARLALNYHLERVDPLFRSVAASTQPDRFQNEIEMTGAIGDFTATVSHQWFHDNLAGIPSLLESLSQRDVAIVSVPLASLWAGGTDGADGRGARSMWLPRLGYNMNRIHQFGRAFPLNGGFNDPSQVPDQVSSNHEFSSEWQFQKWRVAYRFNQSYQDNRQPGRVLSDLLNRTHGAVLGLTPHTTLDLNFDLNVESAKNFETARVDRTLRAGLNTNWRMTPRMTINLTASNTLAGDIARITRSRNTELDLQWSYQFTRGETGWRKFKGQFFIRYADRYARTRDFMFGLDNLTRLKTLNGGINFVFF